MSTSGGVLSSKLADTQPLLPRPYGVGLQNGSISPIWLDVGSLQLMPNGSPSRLRYANVLSLTARSRWPGHGLFVWAPGKCDKPHVRSSFSTASVLRDIGRSVS